MYGIKCNIRAPHKFMRMGALCWIQNVNPGSGGERIEVFGMSRGGRMVETWIDARDLTNFRTGWFQPINEETETSEESDKESARRPGVRYRFGRGKELADEWAAALQARYGGGAVRPHAAAFGLVDSSTTRK